MFQPKMTTTKTAKQFLESQELFNILDTSRLRLDLSWKNKDQVYELECRYCNAVYSDYVITNRFSGSRKSTSADYTFLVCKNCGSCQNDRGIYKKRTYRDYAAGDVPFPNKNFRAVKKYEFEEGTPDIDDEVAKLSCYKELPEDTNPGISTKTAKKPIEPNSIFLCVTDALIASGLNPYEVLKRKKLVEFYATTPHVTQHDYAAFNALHNKEKRTTERDVVAKVDKSTLIKSIANKARFGDAKDDFAVETLEESMKKMNITATQGPSIKTSQSGEEIVVTISPSVDAEDSTLLVRLERKDGCVKTGVLLLDGTIVEDETPSIEEEASTLKEEDVAVLQSYINKTTGCKSEINVHEYLSKNIPNYIPQGKVSVSGVVDGVRLYGYIDAISGKQGMAPDAVIEIKKRMKQIFTLDELEGRRYDLCQLVLYKLLTQQRYKGCEPSLLIVQSFGETITIDDVPLDVQKRIIELYYEGMKEFRKAIEEFEQ